MHGCTLTCLRIFIFFHTVFQLPEIKGIFAKFKVYLFNMENMLKIQNLICKTCSSPQILHVLHIYIVFLVKRRIKYAYLTISLLLSVLSVWVLMFLCFCFYFIYLFKWYTYDAFLDDFHKKHEQEIVNFTSDQRG